MSFTEEDKKRYARKSEENAFNSIMQYIKKNMGPGLNKISPVTQNIFLSDLGAAHDFEQIAAHNINAILRLSAKKTDSKIITQLEKKKITFAQLALPRRANTSTFRAFFSEVYNYVHNFVTQDKHVLVYCDDGVNISPVAILYYFLQRFYMTNFDTKIEKLINPEVFYLVHIVEMVKDARRCISPHAVMISFLLMCENSMKAQLRAQYDAQQHEKEIKNNDLLSEDNDDSEINEPYHDTKEYDELDDLADIAPC
jgi:hypothetical protein